jgi:hypothetical protein
VLRKGASDLAIVAADGGVCGAQRDAFLHHTLSVFKLAYNSPVSDCFQRFTGFYTWLNVVLGDWGKVVWPSVRSLH